MLAYSDRLSSKEKFFGDTRRVCSSRETLKRVEGLFPVMGITRVANITGLDRLGIPVHTACRPNARSLSLTQGKGMTHEDAKASAVMESIETWHAENIQLPLKLCSYNELRFKEKVVDIDKLARPKNSAFTPNKRILWIEGLDLFSGQSRWVPYECVHLDYRIPLPSGSGCFIASSNGLASGNIQEEAILHGMSELIERDALTLWSLQDHGRQMQSRVDIDTVTDPRCRYVLDRFISEDLEVGIWEITSNLGVPSFLCRLLPGIECEISGIRPASGMGCHPSRDIALLRALTEAAQSRLTFIAGSRDDLRRDDYERFLGREEYIKWHKAMTGTGPMKDYKDIRSPAQLTLQDDIRMLLSKLKSNDISEAVVVDLTREEFGIPVTRVIIPGLESFLSDKEIIFGQRASRVFQEGAGRE